MNSIVGVGRAQLLRRVGADGHLLHAWTEGRGEEMVLLTMIDDATSRLLARFYPADTVEARISICWAGG
ncbi:MAG: hypothetical protein U0793_27390 [Gemmataceae bacterium]